MLGSVHIFRNELLPNSGPMRNQDNPAPPFNDYALLALINVMIYEVMT